MYLNEVTVPTVRKRNYGKHSVGAAIKYKINKANSVHGPGSVHSSEIFIKCPHHATASVVLWRIQKSLFIFSI